MSKTLLIAVALAFASLAGCKSKSLKFCEEAYNEMLVHSPRSATRYPREPFLNGCKELPPEVAHCMSRTYERAHETECRPHENRIEAFARSVRVNPPVTP